VKTAALAILLSACATDVDRSRGALGETEIAPARELAVGAPEILDTREDGALLVGTLEPATEGTDEERVLILHGILDGAALDRSIEGLRVTDARFVRDSIATIGADGVLRVHVGGVVREIDAHAYGPLSVAGTRVAYTRGEIPLLELARADVASGVALLLTENMAPVWSPALSEDGERVVFVSGASGSPRLCLLDRDGVRTIESDRIPSSPRAPRFEDGLLSFEDERGDHTSIEIGEAQ
jgi:hypothetical protein